MDTDNGERNRQDAKNAKIIEKDLPRNHVALTGICRSGGSVDTLIREFIRVSGCPPIHVRIADSAAFMDKPFPIRVHPCASVVLSPICVNLRYLRFLSSSVSFLASSLAPRRFNLISVHPCSSVVPLLRVSLSQSAPICVNLRFQHFISFPEF